MFATVEAFQKFAERRDDVKQFGTQDIALLEVNDPVAAGATKAELELATQFGRPETRTYPAFGIRDLGRMENDRLQSLPFERIASRER